jgi:hypothetical protein
VTTIAASSGSLRSGLLFLLLLPTLFVWTTLFMPETGPVTRRATS